MSDHPSTANSSRLRPPRATEHPKAVEAVYFHFPYCRHVCHYCDFAKTANFSEGQLQAYAGRLQSHLTHWINYLKHQGLWPRTLNSVYFGGGTPGLMREELAEIIDVLIPYLDSETEITLETNPNICGMDRLSLWRRLGFNRLSLGVQTFSAKGLQVLTRDHDQTAAFEALSAATTLFPQVSMDLIYGWPDQSTEDWQKDIMAATSTGITHLSAYALTYAPGTPIGRAYARGRLNGLTDDRVADYYQMLRSELAGLGWEHYEVSNWGRTPSNRSRHNIAYWRGEPYLGIGSGAHGFLPDPEHAFGRRYKYKANDRLLLRQEAVAIPAAPTAFPAPPPAPWELPQIEIEGDRGAEAWLTEYVGNGLRWYGGIDLSLIHRLTGRRLRHDAFVTDSLAAGSLVMADERLHLDEAQWFLESSWALRLLERFIPPAGRLSPEPASH